MRVAIVAFGETISVLLIFAAFYIALFSGQCTADVNTDHGCRLHLTSDGGE